jgi:pimeloyl-ACP methyl ester carboxylesterase
MKPTRIAVVVVLAFCGALAAAVNSAAADTAPAPAKTNGRVYLFRGFAGMVFSRGTDHLAERIEQLGFTVDVSEAMMCTSIADKALGDYHRDPEPVVIIGHSVGGACAVSLAEKFKDENIPVKLLVISDTARITHDVPANVERFICLFQSNSLLGGVDSHPGPGFHGHYASYDLVEHSEITHVNMEKTQSVQDQLFAKMQALLATPANTDSEPIHYVVPADAPIELWDSGMVVFAHPDDTPQTVANTYHVPLSAVLQMNNVTDGAPLAPGQRLIVPRYLLPPPPPPPARVVSAPPPKAGAQPLEGKKGTSIGTRRQ